MKNDLYIFGVGQIAEVAEFYFKNDTNFKVIAFLADKDYIKESIINGIPVDEYSEFKSKNDINEINIFVAAGYSNLNKSREDLLERVIKDGFSIKSYISSKSQIYGLVSGVNNFILENNIIQPYSSIGNNNIIWSGNHIGHHTNVGNNNFISSHVVISGSVNIKSNNFFGVNSTVVDNVNIGNKCIIGSCALVDKSLEDESVLTSSKSKLHSFKSSKIKL